MFSACGGPEGPSGAAPVITCPAPVTAPSSDGVSAMVTYQSPTVFGGAPPVLAPTCAPASGSQFLVGTTNVSCSVRDGEGRVAACSFTVRVTAPPQIGATRFVAFGDSITEGKTGECIRPFSGYSAAALAALVQELRLLPNVAPGADYPGALQTLLVNRYTAQTPSVANQGLGGELVSESDTRDRLHRALTDHAAEVLLLQEGINDLHEPGAGPAVVADVVDSLRRMVREAQGRGVKVFLGTLLPERAGSCRAFAPAGTIEATNDGIRAMAAAEGAVLVDLYPVIAADLTTLLGEDGLHPTEAGYSKIADTFFEAIRQQLETPPS
jgi:lysophospholipase L1-like esterase